MNLHERPDAVPSAVFAAKPARDPRLTQPSSPWTLVLGGVALTALAFGVFSSLSHARAVRVDARSERAQAPGTTYLRVAQAPSQPAPPVPSGPELPVFAVAPAASNMGAAGPLRPQALIDSNAANLHAPAMVVDLGEAGGTPRLLDTAAGATPRAAAEAQLSADERFAARVTSGGGADTAHAVQLRDLTRIVPQGATVPAVLETAIDSDLPGSVRAVVSRDVRSYDGSRVLIPRGSKLIGQYRSAAAVGQTRAFVIWSRLLTPSGVSVDIGSPATDRLGRGGLDGQADTHFFRRFGASILLTVLTAGLDAATRGDVSVNTLVIGSPVQASRVAEIALQKQIDIPTTIRVPQGTPVQVSVARDLDFSGVVLAAP